MKSRITITITPELLQYVDRAARRTRRSRSKVIEALIEGAHDPSDEGELRRKASEFFGHTNSQQEHEQEDWLKMSLETFGSDR